jgi:hypothetical protein
MVIKGNGKRDPSSLVYASYAGPRMGVIMNVECLVFNEE